MFHKKAFKAIFALIAMVSDTRLRKLLRCAINHLMAELNGDAERFAELDAAYKTVLAKLENEQREHEDHHRLAAEIGNNVRSLELEIQKLDAERTKLRAYIADLSSELAQGDMKTQRKAKLRLTHAGRTNGILAIKELQQVVPTGVGGDPATAFRAISLARARELFYEACNGDETITVILLKQAPVIDTAAWKEVA